MKTNFTITHSCGHEQDHDLSKIPAGKRLGRAKWLARTACTECWKKANRKQFLAKRDAEELADAKHFEQRNDLPELDAHSDKQLAFARTMRHQVLTRAHEDLADELGEERFETDVMVPARKIIYASWWLDYSDIESADLVEAIRTAVDDPTSTVVCENDL